VPLGVALLGVIGAESPSRWIDTAEVFATVFGFTLAAVMISWEQRASKSAELKLKLFETLHARIREVSEAALGAGTYAISIPLSLELYALSRSNGTPPYIKQTPSEFNEKHGQVGKAVSGLLIALEEHEIVLAGGFGVFKMAFNSAMHDAHDGFKKLFPNLMKRLPLPAPSGADATVWPAASTPAEIDETRDLAYAYQRAAFDVSFFATDLSVACQNELLSDLFPERQAKARQPLDPAAKVIVADSTQLVRDLEQYFRTDTAWGRHIQQVEAGLKAQYAKSPVK